MKFLYSCSFVHFDNQQNLNKNLVCTVNLTLDYLKSKYSYFCIHNSFRYCITFIYSYVSTCKNVIEWPNSMAQAINPATLKAEVGGSQAQSLPGQLNKTPSQNK